MSDPGKYRTPESEAEVLPNLLGLTTLDEIQRQEFEGILEAARITINEVSNETEFNLDYIYRIHHLAFGELYEFAGKLRTVNISKGGFVFPSALYLNETMKAFESEMLSTLPNTSDPVKAIAAIHAELLFIHPFREGNGRVARILADAMATKYGLALWKFELIGEDRMEEYISAVQSAAESNYAPMEKLFRSIL